jgi:hypothetical protein
MFTDTSCTVVTQTRGHIAGRHALERGQQEQVRDHFDLDVEDNPQQPIASDHQAEQVGILGARAAHNGAIRQHQAHGTHG